MDSIKYPQFCKLPLKSMSIFSRLRDLTVIVLLCLSHTAAYASVDCSTLRTSTDFEVTWALDTGYKTTGHLLSVINENVSSAAIWAFTDKELSQLFSDSPRMFDFAVEKQYRLSFSSKDQTFEYQTRTGVSIFDWWSSWSSPIYADASAHAIANVMSLKNIDNDPTDNWKSFTCDQEPVAMVPDIELCEYFPEPLQAWSTSSKFDLSSPPTDQITGFSADYQSKYQTDITVWGTKTDALMLGFAQDNDRTHRTMNCQTGACIAFDQSKTNDVMPLAPVPLSIEPVFSSNTSLTIDFHGGGQQQPQNVCKNNPDKCHYDSASKQLTIIGDLNQLTVFNSGWQVNKQITVVFEPQGNHPLSIRSYTQEGRITSKFSAGGNYIFETYTTNSELAKIETEENVVIAIIRSMTFNKIEHQDIGQQGDLLIYGPDATITINGLSSGEFTGYILGKSVTVNNTMTLQGGMTTNALVMHGASYIKGTHHCSAPPISESFSLAVSSEKQTALTCESPQVQFTVLNESGIGAPLTNDTQVTISHTADTLTLVPGKGSQSGSGYLPNDSGELWFSVANHQVEQDVTINAALNPQQDSDSVKTSIDFVPYAFISEPLTVVAGYPTQTKVSVASCHGNAATTVNEYQNSPSTTIAISQPRDGVIGQFAYNPSFTQGQSTSLLQIDQVGQYSLQLIDSSFDCSDLAGCPEAGVDTLSGRIEVTSKPWRFELCDANNQSVDGTSHAGDKYKMAGEEFNITVSPMAYREQPTMCDAAAITTNYWLPHDGYPEPTIALSHTLHTPQAGVVGVLSSADGLERPILPQAFDIFPPPVTEGRFTRLKYSEVGSLLLSAKDSGSFYTNLSANIANQTLVGVEGDRAIGRFAPAYIEITDTQWNYPSLHNGFAYMGQPMEHSFSVNAFNAESPPSITQNYGLFDDPLIVDIAYRAYDSEGNSLLARIEDHAQSAMARAQSSFLTWNGGDWDSTGLNVQFSEFVFNKKVNPANVKATVADGPITERFALEVVNPVDGVDFSMPDTTQLESDLTSQPLFRYGRVALKDTSGNTGTETRIPLTTQYWNGSRFVTNVADDGTDFTGVNYCVKTHWRSDSALTSASMQHSSKVAQGYDTGLTVMQNAQQSSNVREQSRFWLRLGDETDSELLGDYQAERCSGNKGSRPWLQYDWNNTGDQDPSTLVTFGTHRGNDRVIFRGEPGLTGF